MVIRSVRLIIEFAIGAILGAGFLLGLIIWRMSGEAVSLAFLTPYLERTLSAEDGSFTVRLDDTVLKWAGWKRTLDIRMLGVKAVGPSGQVLAAVPDIAVSLSLRGLLHGFLAPTRLEILSPRIRVVRSAEGSLQLGLEGGGPEAGDILGRLVTDLLSPPDPDNAMGYLRTVSITDADASLIDERMGTTWHAPDADVVLARDVRGISGEMTLALDLAGTRAEIDAKVGYDRDARKVELSASFRDLDPSKLSAQRLPVPGLDAVAMPLQGAVNSTLDLDGHVETFGFDVSGGPGKVAVADWYREPLEVRFLQLRGRVEEDMNRLVLEQGYADLGGPSAELTGHAYRAGGGVTTQGEVVLRNVPVDSLDRYWPATLAVDARTWIVAHLSKGEVSEARAVIAAKAPGGDLHSLVVESLAGTLKTDGVTVDYLQPMPPVENVSGRASFTKERFDIAIQDGGVYGLKVSEGKVGITGLDVKDQTADVEIVVKGPVQDVIKLLDHEPIGAAHFLGVSPDALGGESATRAVFRIPLEKKLQFAGLGLAAAANIRGLVIRNAALGQDLTDGSLTVTVDKSAFQGKGTIALGGVPATLSTTQNFEKGGPFRSRYELTARPDDADLGRIGFPVAPYIVGPVPIGLTYTVMDGGAADLALAADLGPAALDFKDIGWSKPARAQGAASLDLTLADNRPKELRAFSVTAGTLNATGKGAFTAAPNGASRMQSLSFTRLAFGRSDVAGTVTFRDAGGFDVVVSGREIDLADQFAVRDTAKPKKKEKGPPFTVRAGAETLWVASDRKVRNAQLAADHDELRLTGLQLTGEIGDAKTPGTFDIRMAPEAKGRILSATSNDAGTMLRTFGIFDDVQGGQLRLTGRIDDTDPDSPFSGRLTIKNYRVLNTPVLAQIVTVASLTGIVNLMSGEGIGFTDFDAPITLRNDTLTVTDARAFGPDLGLTLKGTINVAADTANLEGTIVPAYAINSILGNIPILGELLTGGKGSGVFAGTFRVEGPLAKPDVTVNPLAALTPGFLRNLFGIFSRPADGEASAPAPPGKQDQFGPPR
ncbi:MAG: AsmA-like C-terminal domain-containing protein [Alphaproteobacteria bacterium]